MSNTETPLDCLIVGGGPAGIAIAHTLHQNGIAYRIYEKGPIAWHISQYPHFMRFFSTNENLEIAGFPLTIAEEKPDRRQYLNYLARFAEYNKLHVETYARVTAADRQADGSFLVTVERPGGRRETIAARAVVVACGAWEAPRKLDVPGGDLEKVRYRFTEAHDYRGKKVLVVGGRNAAIDLALELWRAGAEVSLSYRGKSFDGRGVKYWLKPDIDNRIANGEIAGYLGSHVKRIDWETVEIETADGETVTIENDFVLPMFGYDPPVAFLKSLGIELAPDTNEPKHDPETLETNVPGLFVAGTIIWGNVSGKVFIENSRHHGEMILPRLLEIKSEAGAAAL